MKTILLIRHAKSSWDNFSVKDQERPLNDRGKRNAPEMAKRLMEKGIPIDEFISSPAKRARATAVFFAEVYGKREEDILFVPELYMADQAAFTNTILHAPTEADTIALFSHNTGITSFANSLSDAKIAHMPTCSVFAVKCTIDHWTQFSAGSNTFYFFDYPKAL